MSANVGSEPVDEFHNVGVRGAMVLNFGRFSQHRVQNANRDNVWHALPVSS